MDKRFTIEKVKSDKLMMETLIITDQVTGVQYLYAAQGYGAGLTPLLDKEGKPLLVQNNYFQ